MERFGCLSGGKGTRFLNSHRARVRASRRGRCAGVPLVSAKDVLMVAVGDGSMVVTCVGEIVCVAGSS